MRLDDAHGSARFSDELEVLDPGWRQVDAVRGTAATRFGLRSQLDCSAVLAVLFCGSCWAAIAYGVEIAFG